jgi:aspartate racemase
MRVVDFRDLSNRERSSKVKGIVADESRRPFDLSREPPLRAVLLRLGAAEYVLVLTLHHVAFDDWSYEILKNDIALTYRTIVNGEPPPVSALQIQYADYAAWQNEWLLSPAADQELSHWLDRLQDDPHGRASPTHHARPSSRIFRYDERIQPLGRTLTERLKAFSCQASATPFMTILAAINVLLAQMTGLQDIWVGTLTANRDDTLVQNVIGLFANTLVLRTDLSGNPTFDQLVQRVRRATLDAFDHQILPFERLLETLRERVGPAEMPLFQVLVVSRHELARQIQLPGLIIEPLESCKKQRQIEVVLSTFDLIVEIASGKQDLNLIWRYNMGLYEPGTVDKVLSYFASLLASTLEYPEKSVWSWPLRE